MNMSDTPDPGTQIWQIPDLGDEFARAAGAGSRDPHATAGTSDQDQSDMASRDQGYMEGFEQGINEGRELAQQQASKEQQQIALLFQTLQKMYQRVDDDTIEELAQLSAIVSEQVIKTELMLKPELIRNVVRDLVDQLPHGYKKVQIALHGDDLRTLQHCIADFQDIDTTNWQLIVNDQLSRGDCQLTTDDSLINAELRSHVESIISASLTEILGE